MVFLEEVSLINDLKRIKDFPGDSDGKASAYNAGDQGSIPGSGRSPGEGNGNPLQYCCLEKSMDGGTWWAIVPGATKSQTRLIDFTFTFFLIICMKIRVFGTKHGFRGLNDNRS